MLSLIGAMSEHLGEAKAAQWASGVVANFARQPRGGDTDQIHAVASGECGVALTNTYYLVRLMRSDKPADKATVVRIGIVWPNQTSFGTHVNVSGGGVAKNAPHRDNAVSFLEYLASESSAGLSGRRQQRVAGGRRRQAAQPGTRVAGQVQGRRAADRVDRALASRPRRASSIAPAGADRGAGRSGYCAAITLISTR